MKKLMISVMVMVLGAGMLSAQAPMKGISSGGASGDGIDAVLGYPMMKLGAPGGTTLVSGLPFSELEVKDEGTVSVLEGSSYSDPYFTFPSVTMADAGVHTKYAKHVLPKKYDALAKIILEVIPCSSLTPSDADGNAYTAVAVAGYCWTKENLKASDGIAKALAYGDDASNADVYGRLYTWYSAVGLAEGSTDAPSADAAGFVQGVCPADWHIPTSEEMAALRTMGVPALNATTLWQGPNASDNTNSTGFTALPAGKYNAALNRYEGLGTQTDWWSVVYTTSGGVTVTSLVTECAYYCDSPMEKYLPVDDAVSVRCVKNY